MTHQHCLLCKGHLLKPLKGYEHAFLVKCNNCGFVFCSRVPSQSELLDHYKNYPQFATLSPITKKRYSELLERLEPFRKTNNLMDLGCGSGLFLECAREKGWNVHGTEFSAEIIKAVRSKGIEVHKADELPQELFNLKFDVVSSFEVLEHVNTPHEEVELVNKLLRPGGALYITTPNFNAFSRLILKSKWNVIEYPEHLSYYTPSTLHQLLDQHGLLQRSLTTSGFSVGRYKESVNAGADSSGPRQEHDEALRKKLEKNFLLRLAKNTANTALGLLGRGDAMKALYVKT